MSAVIWKPKFSGPPQIKLLKNISSKAFKGAVIDRGKITN